MTTSSSALVLQGAFSQRAWSEEPKSRVLLLEAGGTDSALEVQIPAVFSKLFKGVFDWNGGNGRQFRKVESSRHASRHKNSR
jgi:hypothetical protein